MGGSPHSSDSDERESRSSRPSFHRTASSTTGGASRRYNFKFMTFTGRPDPRYLEFDQFEKWYTKFLIKCDAHDYSEVDILKTLPSHLDGRAQEFYLDLSADVKYSLPRLVNALKQQYPAIGIGEQEAAKKTFDTFRRPNFLKPTEYADELRSLLRTHRSPERSRTRPSKPSF